MEDKIDFVVTWVDGNDVKWQEEKNKYDRKGNDEASSIIRYRDWELTKYWFRAVEKYAPWVNNVFFITCGHLPNWLNLENPKLKFIKHTDFMPQEVLPTFNSNAIELYINRIPNLEEKFVYFNDDQFITSPVKSCDFFQEGKPKDALVFNAVSVNKENNIIEHTILNNLELVAKYFEKKDIQTSKLYNIKYGLSNIRNILLSPWKYYTGILNQHVPISHLKSTFDEVWNLEEDELYKTTTHKFRTKEDYSHWVFRYWNLVKGNFIPTNMKKCKYINLENENKEFVENVINGKYKMVCINDSDETIQFDKVKNEMIQMFEKILPEKSSFEK